MNLKDLPSAAAALRNSTDSALFVTSQLRPRELKMADGLRRLGWKVGLIYYKWTPFDPLAYFDFSLEVDSAKKAHEFAKELAPRLCHVFSGAIDDLVLTFCRDKPSAVVIDLNDIFAPSLFDYCHERFEPTREALALADGFCARDLQLKSAERVDHFQLPPKLIFFPEYCWNRPNNLRAPGERTKSDEVHVVSVGTFSLETQGMYDSCYMHLTQLLIDQGIHFHIYPHWAYRQDHFGSPHVNFERDFAEFLALEKSSSYLHVHESLSIEELGKVLPRYDFGIVSGGCAQFGQKLKFYHAAYIETCYSGRISDYLDARLPVLINDEVKFDYWILKRYGVCVDLKGILRTGFKGALLQMKQDGRLQETMEHAVQKLSVNWNSPRLASFYREIIAAGITNQTNKEVEEAPGQAFAQNRTTAIVAPAGPAADTNRFAASPLVTSLRRKIRWASPRAAKILLPYRAIHILERRLHNSLQENQSNQATISDLQEENNSNQVRITALQGQLVTIEGSVSTARTEVGRLEKTNAAILIRADQLEENTKALAALTGSLEAGNARLQGEVEDLRSEVDRVRQNDAALEARNSELQRHIETLAALVRALETERGILRTGKADLQSKLEIVQQSEAALMARNGELQSDNEALAAAVRSLEAEKEILRAGNAELQIGCERLRKSDTALRVQTEALQRDKEALAAVVESLESERENLRTERTELRSEVVGLQQADALRMRDAEFQQNTQELQGRLEDLKRESEEASRQIHILSNEKYMLQQEVRWGKLPINEIAGVLNWPEVLNDVERTNGFKDLIRILGLFSRSASVADSPSVCWDLLATKNYDQLLTHGYRDFKRTVGTNYFNFLVQKGDPQIHAVESLLPPEVIERCVNAALAIPEDASLPCPDQFAYKYFVLLLWEYVKTIDRQRYFERLEEPVEGNPILVASEGRQVSQDLANTLIEYCAIGEAMSFEDIDSVLEIGGGYGRNAYIILALNPNIKVTMVDIPPALYIAQRYLASMFKERRVFKARDFSHYGEVKGELESASIVFLLPHQLALMPNKRFDFSMNISSFGEMRADQVQWYFKQLGRVTRRYFYMKQWRTSTNVFDGVVLKEGDYPCPKNWTAIFSRPCRVQTEFFEACYQVK